ncbi:MAG: hypothetical protein CL565_03250 [Alphaproteobacteria bacterium]|nr:hypothetical protein [Alphaproteobacteria bacterium]
MAYIRYISNLLLREHMRQAAQDIRKDKSELTSSGKKSAMIMSAGRQKSGLASKPSALAVQ